MATKKERMLKERIRNLELGLEERDAAISEFYYIAVSLSFILCVSVFGTVMAWVDSVADPRTALTFLPLVLAWYSMRLRDNILK